MPEINFELDRREKRILELQAEISRIERETLERAAQWTDAWGVRQSDFRYGVAAIAISKGIAALAQLATLPSQQAVPDAERLAECLIAVLGCVYDKQGNHAHPGDKVSEQITALVQEFEAEVRAAQQPDSPHPEDCQCACYYRGETDERHYQEGKQPDSPTLRRQVELAAIRYQILLDRMYACPVDETGGHEVSKIEVPGWIDEARAALARPIGEKSE